jgi:hypothetical protein
MKDYCKKKKLPYRILLLLHSAPGHPLNVADFSSNIKMVFLPSNMTSQN